MKNERRKYRKYEVILVFAMAILFLFCSVISVQAADMGEIHSGETKTGLQNLYHFSDDFESGLGNWIVSGHDWNLTTSTSRGGNYSVTDSPDGNYPNDANAIITLAGIIDLSGSDSPVLTFWHKYSIGGYDYIYVEISTDGGWTWSELKSWYDGEYQSTWTLEQINLSDYKTSQVKIRFRLRETGSYESDGWYIDDVEITGINQLPVATFTYFPPDPLVNEAITFNASASYDPDGGDIMNYEWNFGDGNITSTSEEIITHSYSEAGDYVVNLTVTDDEGEKNTASEIIPVSTGIFDTGAPANPYPSIMGTHNGTITPSHDVMVNRMYTYPCAGTGGHSEYAWIYGNGINVNATWNGYQGAGDYHYLEFSEPFTLEANVTYNYTIKTGSYPQIHHTDRLEIDGGVITCDNFVDANGKIHYDWIPAIRLESL